MPLKSFVYSAMKNEPPKRQYQPGQEIQNFIDATNPDTIKRITPEGEVEVKLTWKECINQKVTGERIYCKKFLGFCAKEKCPSKFMDFK